jgi:hypothetical protein
VASPLILTFTERGKRRREVAEISDTRVPGSYSRFDGAPSRTNAR